MKQPILIPIPNENKYFTDAVYITKQKIGKKQVVITVPRGFVFDGASIPSFGWKATYTPFHPDVMAPALVHDYFYRDPESHIFSRKEVDDLFYDMLRKNTVSKKHAWRI